MRTLSTALKAHMNGTSTTTAFITRVTRRDGVQLGFSFTDIPIVFGGLTYYPQGSVSATSLSQTADNGIDNLDFTGVLSSDRITDDDLRRGLYDGAEILVSEVNYNDLSMGSMIILRGYVGEVEVNSNGQFRTEVRSLEQFMSVQIGDATSPTCRVRRFGDAQCKVNIATYTVTGTVGPNGTDLLNVLTNVTGATDFYTGGILRITAGANAGLERDIRQYTPGTGQVYLQEGFPFVIAAGTSMAMERGCDRRFVTCDGYGNTINFHGEPYLPGNDKLLSTARPPS